MMQQQARCAHMLSAVSNDLSDASNGIVQLHAQHLDYLLQSENCDVVFTPLNCPHVGPMDATPVRQFLLGPAFGGPCCPEILPEPDEGGVFLGHARKMAVCSVCIDRV